MANHRYLGSHEESYEINLTEQARPNVIFEAGMAFGFYPSRTLIVSFGKTRRFTDIDGFNILFIKDDSQSRQKIASRLKNAGCDVNTDNKVDWLTSGDFALAYHDDIDHRADEKYSGLTITDRRYSAQENATYKPKLWVELRNENSFCVEVNHQGWKESIKSVQIKTSFRSMQMKIGKQWCPKDEGVESLYVPPSSLIQMWLQPSEKHTEDELKDRCTQDGRIGLLDLRVDGRTVQINI